MMQFGSEGTGPGQFQDARHIAVDPDGNIYVADYDTGRLQKFDSSGKFLQLINVESNQNAYSFIMDMAVDYAGHLFVVRVPDILSYNTADLSKAQTIPGRFPGINFRFMAIDPANQLYAVSDGVQFTDLIKMDSAGEVLWTVQGVIINLDQRANPSVDDVAVDGLGSSYLVNDIDARIYKFNADGKYVDRFGVKGDAPGQLDKPSRIVVDPEGRLAISDLDGFDFFTSEGEFLDGMPWDYTFGGIRGFAFDMEGHLFVITTNQQVLKFELNF
jgi:DNA-binding beta-propeller fold protein YncE